MRSFVSFPANNSKTFDIKKLSILKELLHEKTFYLVFMLFHLFVQVKLSEHLTFVLIFVLEIFTKKRLFHKKKLTFHFHMRHTLVLSISTLH